jgi:hypothetical protein
MNNPILEFLMKAAAHERGIVPLERNHHDFNRILASLPPDDARAMKRKFRKLWRKVARNKQAKNTRLKHITSGLGNQNPTRTHKNNRKHMVYAHLWLESAMPLHKKIEQGDT